MGKGGRGTWCISTVTVEPALTGHLPLALPALALHRIWVEATSVMGELESCRKFMSVFGRVGGMNRGSGSPGSSRWAGDRCLGQQEIKYVLER